MRTSKLKGTKIGCAKICTRVFLLPLAVIFFFSCSRPAPAPRTLIIEEKDVINIPEFGDKYCDYVKALEEGQTDIDYQDFRFSFLESEQFEIALKQSAKLDSLTDVMYLNMDLSNYEEIIWTTKQMLSIDYTDMLAHKFLGQTYKIVGDTINAQKYKDIQYRLLFSIVTNGDGKSCQTAWPVIQISEEYFILQMLDAKLKSQSVWGDKGGLCDKMDVIVHGEDQTYYFEIKKVFEKYPK
ncbi:MAG: DUF4919 domain-containing protein [Candidatus Symbiothrix sp.]|jgi:hypothetical protein|nr:DUF4919 domain-containing protein [Candidatus Symbiothrix sp.]